MAVGRYATVRRLFLDALDRPEAERDAFVSARTAGDAAVAEAVRALLAEHTEQLWQSDSSPFRDEAAPAAIGPYRIERELGRGGMGVVWLGRRNDGAPVALKRAHLALAGPEARERFEREADALASLDHPAIARLLDRGLERTPAGVRPWFAMEFVDGAPLRHAVATHQWALERRLAFLATIADALHHAHEHGVLHRDVKPSNVMVRADGSPCLLDFGIARRLASDGSARADLTTVGIVLGTTPYMSPEQARGERERLDARTDVFSLAVTAFEWLTGTLPHEPVAPTHSAILVAIVSQSPRLLRDAQPALPRPLERVFAMALARDPAHRFATAAEFAADLRRAARGESVLAPAVPLVARVRRQARRHRGALAAAGLAVAMLLATAIPGALRWASAERRPGVVLARFDAVAERIDPTVRPNDRTLATLDAGLATYDSLARTLGPLRSEPWSADLRRAIHWRRAEIRIWRAEMTADPADLHACIAELETMRRLRPTGASSPAVADPAYRFGDLVRGTTAPEAGLSLIAGCHEMLAEMERPRTHLQAASRAGMEALRLGLALPEDAAESTLVRVAIAHTDSSERYHALLHGAAAPLVHLAALTADSVQRERGFALLTRALRPTNERSPPPRAAVQHTMGEAWLDRAAQEQSLVAVDSALSYFRLALDYRRGSPGNLSYFETRRAAARAIALRATLAPRRARAELAAALGVLAADEPNVRPDAHASHRGHIALALATLHLDRLERHDPGVPPADVAALLANAAAAFDPARMPLPAARVHLERARLARLTRDAPAARAALHAAAGLVPADECPPLEAQLRAETARLERRTRETSTP